MKDSELSDYAYGDADDGRSEESSSSSMYQDTDDEDEGTNIEKDDKIALFGAYGSTGDHFTRLALDAGYSVRALILPGAKSESNIPCSSAYVSVVGSLEDNHKVEEVLSGATYVICMLSDTLTKTEGYKSDCFSRFVKILYPLMKSEPTIQLFLYQATSLATDIQGSIPIFSTILRHTIKRNSQILLDHDNVIKYIASQHGFGHQENNKSKDEHEDRNGEKNEIGSNISNMVAFPFIITRPTFLLMNGKSRKELVASKSQPGPFPEVYVDVAEFTLNAIQTKKLYNTCPYVVGDV